MKISLAAHSSPRFSTWLWANDWRTLIDAGDGATQQMGYKIRKVDTVLCTHAHRDHIGGLLQVINQRGEAGPFALAHPCGSRSFSDLAAFALKFNPGASHQAIWHALEESDSVETGIEGRWVRAFRTRHYSDDRPQNAPKSLGFHLMWRKQKVRADFAASASASWTKCAPKPEPKRCKYLPPAGKLRPTHAKQWPCCSNSVARRLRSRLMKSGFQLAATASRCGPRRSRARSCFCTKPHS
jgi:hypothetical protein